MHPLLENVGRQCLQAWDDLTDVNRLHALEQVVATGGSSPALLGTAARAFAGAPAPAPELGEKILRLVEQLTPAQAQQLPDATVNVLVQSVQSHPELTPVRLLAARHRAGRLLAADVRGVNCFPPETAELLDSVRDQWDELPDLATAAAVLDAAGPSQEIPTGFWLLTEPGRTYSPLAVSSCRAMREAPTCDTVRRATSGATASGLGKSLPRSRSPVSAWAAMSPGQR